MPDIQNPDTYSDEINLLDYLKVINRHRRLIILIVLISVVVTAGISLIMTPVFEAKALIAPAAQQKEISPLSGFAAQFGISTPASANLSEIVNLLKSNVLRENMMKRNNLLSVFFEKDGLEGLSEHERTWKGLRYLESALKVNLKQKEGMVEVSMQFKDPQKAAGIVNNLLEELTDYMSSEAKRVAETNKKYLESQIDKTSDPLIKTKIYSMIAQQIEQSMMAEVKENFAFKVIDPPKAPDKRIKPKRRQMVMLSFVASLFGGVFIAFLKEYIDKMRKA